MKKTAIPLSLLLLLISTTCTFGQSREYDPAKVFDATFLNEPGNSYRSANGAPGPLYWQNRADYKINVSLNDENHRITGSAVITYTNNSPDALQFLWLHLEQNLYKKSSLGAQTTPAGGRSYAPRDFTGGYQIKSVEVSRSGNFKSANYLISDTRMQIRLQRPLKAKGEQIHIKINYAFTVPKYGVSIMGRMKTDHGWIYEMGQWYPRMAVYDDVNGWNTLPFMSAGEFYLEYGNFDYTVEVPWNFIVAGSGKLQNPQDVLTQKQIESLEEARRTNKKVTIIKPKDVGTSQTRPIQNGRLTWHFKISGARDAAWAASPAFAWDAEGFTLPGNKEVLSMAVYPPESAGKDRWGRATEYVKASLQFFSKFYDFNYPYPVAVNVGGPVGGMEYPGIVYCSSRSGGRGLMGVTAHEFGHTWFPMIVGSNERRYAWMDEGFNSFADFYATQHFNNGEFARPYQISRITQGMKGDNLQPILTYADQLRSLGFNGYSKPAAGLHILREVVLGPKKFDYAFQQYVQRWAFKHPQPKDFFRTMNNASGVDLNWFWKAWFYKTWTLDQAITNVVQDSTGAFLVTITNNNQMVMPVIVQAWPSNGEPITKKLPVQIWQKTGTWTFKIHANSPLDSVKLDPEVLLPDVNRDNNTWKGN